MAAVASVVRDATARKLLTLLHVVRDGRVLLGMKKRGFGKGKWNGFGGKVEPGETIDAAAVRELQEEAGIRALDARRTGVLHFEFENDPVQLEVHVYRATAYEGSPVESDEMRPAWFQVDEVPLADMWKDDELWWPHVIRNELFYGAFLFRGEETVLASSCEKVDALPDPSPRTAEQSATMQASKAKQAAQALKTARDGVTKEQIDL